MTDKQYFNCSVNGDDNVRNVHPSQSELHRLFEYSKETGDFTWRDDPTKRACVNARVTGKKAGGLQNNGYVVIKLKKKAYVAHRLAWIFCNGEIPRGYQIDHINRNPADNRIVNLRLATPSQNLQNSVRKKDSRLPRGVCACRGSSTFIAKIQHHGIVHHLGSFRTPDEASAAYVRRGKVLYGKFFRHETEENSQR